MIVAGGCYYEECTVPHWRQIFGSGGRAAAAIALLSPNPVLHTYCPDEYLADVTDAMDVFGVKVVAARSRAMPYFSYFHPLAKPDIRPREVDKLPALEIDAGSSPVLRFGFVEGSARVSCERAVFDPQSGESPEFFRKNGSSAKELAIVLNEIELLKLTETDNQDAAIAALFAADDPDVIVVKAGVKGGSVHMKNQPAVFYPAHSSDYVFKIGSGDVFTAIFAVLWAEKGMPPIEAARTASRATAFYCANRSLPIPSLGELPSNPLPINPALKRVYLAAPFFNIGERWVVEQARMALLHLGVPVFSPLHDVGGGPPEHVAPADLAALEECGAMLAILSGSDPGTLFEAGYARKKGIPVVALTEDVSQSDLTMIIGSGCQISPDFASALYQAAWAAMEK